MLLLPPENLTSLVSRLLLTSPYLIGISFLMASMTQAVYVSRLWAILFFREKWHCSQEGKGPKGASCPVCPSALPFYKIVHPTY